MSFDVAPAEPTTPASTEPPKLTLSQAFEKVMLSHSQAIMILDQLADSVMDKDPTLRDALNKVIGELSS